MQQGPVGHHVVDLIGLLRALARGDGPGQPAAGVRGLDRLEHHQRIVPRRLLGFRAQPGALGHPGVPDLAAAAVVDEHRHRMRPVGVAGLVGMAGVAGLIGVGEGHGQRLVAAADVGEVPAVTGPRGTEGDGPGRVGHAAVAKAGRGLPGGGPQGGRAERGQHPQQGQRQIGRAHV